MVTGASIHVVFLGFSAFLTAVLAVYAFYRRREPGALSFVALMVAVTLWTAPYAMGLATVDPWWRQFWESCKWFGAAFVPVTYAVFALVYTGHDTIVTERTVGLLSVVPVVTIALVFTNPYHHLIWLSTSVNVVEGIALLETPFGPWFWVFVAYGWALTAIGSVLVFRLVFVSDYLYADQSALLLVGMVAPLVGNMISVFFEWPVAGIDLAPYSFTVTGLALAYALFHRRLFELVPATRQLGRDAAIRQLAEGVLIVDTNARIIYCNPTAAAMLDCEASTAIGEPVRSFVDEPTLNFETEDALAVWDREDAVYEVRTSPIQDQRSRLIGHTLVIQDVTARKRRERRLARQRDELERLDDLNALIRGVNRALVSATDRAGIEQAVCDRLADSDLFETACAADVPTWNGSADRWTVAGAAESEATLPADLDTVDIELEEEDDGVVSPDDGTPADDRGGWTVIPVVYGRTVYGAIGLHARRGPVTDGGEIRSREREVLAELGELVGHAINAVENQQLLAADAVVELDFQCRDATAPLVRASEETGSALSVTGIVPDGGASHLAYVRVGDGDSESVADAFSSVSGTDVTVAHEADDDALLEWPLPAASLFGLLVDHGANVLDATASEGTVACTVEVASDADGRTLVERVRESFPDTQLVAKRERQRPAERADSLPDAAIDGLTARQEEALEVAYRAGYFEWPRENTAEDVAETLDVSSPTFHYHLRQAQGAIMDAMLDSNRRE